MQSNAANVPHPGTSQGPCINPCTHIFCEMNRAIAALKCSICKKPIGYGRWYYRHGDGPGADHVECVDGQS